MSTPPKPWVPCWGIRQRWLDCGSSLRGCGTTSLSDETDRGRPLVVNLSTLARIEADIKRDTGALQPVITTFCAVWCDVDPTATT